MVSVSTCENMKTTFKVLSDLLAVSRSAYAYLMDLLCKKKTVFMISSFD